MKKLLSVVVTIAMISSLSAPAFAADRTWSGTTDGVWATGGADGNWSNAAAPGVGDNALFVDGGGATDTINLGTGASVETIYFQTAACVPYTIGSAALQKLTVGNGGGLNMAALCPETQLIVADIYLNAAGSNATLENDAGAAADIMNITGNIVGSAVAGTLTLKGDNTGGNKISGTITPGAGALAVTKSDAGYWTLSGTNTYTGTTTVNAGRLYVDSNAAALGAGALTMAGGELRLISDADTNFGRNTTVSGNCAIYSGRNTAGAGTTLSLGTLSIGANTLTANVGDNGTTSGVQGLTFGDVTLTGNATITTQESINTGSGLLTLGNVTSAGNKLTLNSTVGVKTVAVTMGTMADISGGFTITQATGLVTVGAIGATTAGAVTITDSKAGVTFNSTVAATTLTITDTAAAKTISFQDNLTTTGAMTVGAGTAAYNVSITGGANTIAGDTNFSNTGLTTIGNGAGDSSTFTGGLGAVTAGGVSIAGTVATTNTQMDLGATTLTAASSVTTGGGVLNIASVTNGGFLLTIDAGAGASAIPGIITGTGGLTKAGAGVLTISSGANTYTGATTINAGTLALDATGTIATSSGVANNGTFTIAGAAKTIDSLTGAGATTLGNILTIGDASNTSCTYSGVASGAGGITKAGTGTLTLSGTNTYTGVTTITTGTLQASNSQALGTGAAANVAHATAGTLDIGSTTLNIGGTYTQAGAATLMVAVNGTAHGSIVAAGAATVPTTASLVLAVSNYVPNNATYTIINGTGGAGVAAPIITTTGDNRATFTATTVGEDLILTASRTANGFASDATSGNSNASAVGTVLDTISNQSADMTTVLNTMEGLSNAQVASSLDTLVPEVDAGVIDTSTTVLNNFVGVAMDRVEQTLKLAKAADSAATGISAGEASKLSGIWAKGYGSYLTQGTRNGIAGYDAWNAGTALGADHLFADLVTVGMSGGYAYGDVDSDVNNASTYINSAQTTVYGGYADKNLPYFIDAAGSFAWNWYDGQRDINVGNTMLRTANASYDGQQYGAYIGGGYRFDVTKNIEFTPLLSLQYNHLQLQSYTETEAGALNLSVASQGYDQLQSGLGARVAAPIKCKWGTFTPEAHGKWFYDFIGDGMVVSSNFNGGGAAFNSNGAKPALNSFNAGGELTFDFKNNISLIANCDTEMKDEFFGIYGSATVRYEF